MKNYKYLNNLQHHQLKRNKIFYHLKNKIIILLMKKKAIKLIIMNKKLIHKKEYKIVNPLTKIKNKRKKKTNKNL